MERITKSTKESFIKIFRTISGSDEWINQMEKKRPYNSLEEILKVSKQVFEELSKEEVIKAFNDRPLLGDIVSDKSKVDLFSHQEDSLNYVSKVEEVQKVYNLNDQYIKKFGYIMILFCEGMTPNEQYDVFKKRLENDEKTEWNINCVEEYKIIESRIRKIWSGEDPYLEKNKNFTSKKLLKPLDKYR
jgi:2-oxo-4-hydroxy-4-carboxy-5-ureidoimidazoline decarboxylase